MSNPVQDQEEDIIILGDNTDVNQLQSNIGETNLNNNDNSIINLDTKISEPSSSETETNISTNNESPFDFGIDNKIVEEVPVVQEEKKEEISFSGFDLSSQDQITNSQEGVLNMPEQQIPQTVSSFLDETKPINDTFSFSQTDTSSSSGTTSTQGDDDMNGILEATIQKLKARQIAISEEKDEKITQIDTRNDKIKTLKEEVSDLKDNVEALDTENQKIEANITSLEKMKLGNEVVEVEAKKRVARAKAV